MLTRVRCKEEINLMMSKPWPYFIQYSQEINQCFDKPVESIGNEPPLTEMDRIPTHIPRGKREQSVSNIENKYNPIYSIGKTLLNVPCPRQ